MKIRTSIILAAGVCGLFLTVQSGFAQGSLTPPGAPAPTMITLSQIEPRTPISSLPYTITNSGSYYVTTNLTGVSGSDGIDIKTNDVTLDLNGFTLQGVAGNVVGVNVLNPARNLAIRNGVLDSWGENGVNAINGYNSQFERLRVSNTGGGFAAGSNCVVLVCSAFDNNGDGILVGNNCIVKDCTSIGNNTDGYYVMNNCTVEGCIASGNHSDGIYVQNNNCQIVGNACSGNGLYGVEISGVRNRIDNNSVGNNTSYGINEDSTNVDNSITRNFSPGSGYGGYGGSPNNNDYAPIGRGGAFTNAWANFQ